MLVALFCSTLEWRAGYRSLYFIELSSSGNQKQIKNVYDVFHLLNCSEEKFHNDSELMWEVSYVFTWWMIYFFLKKFIVSGYNKKIKIIMFPLCLWNINGGDIYIRRQVFCCTVIWELITCVTLLLFDS